MSTNPEADAPEAFKPIRLQRFLAQAGLGSRRECEEHITSGRVTVDGVVVDELGATVTPSQQRITFDGERLRVERKKYFMLNKPIGYLCTAKDPEGRRLVLDLFPQEGPRLFTVGRLDENTTGLLIVTNDGDLSQKLSHPRYRIFRTYVAQVAGNPSPDVYEQLREGMFFTEGKFRMYSVKPIRKQKGSTWVEIVMTEGQNREVRRLFARVGHKVMKLQREAFGPLRLGRLKLGEYRELSREELGELHGVLQRNRAEEGIDPNQRSRSTSASPSARISSRTEGGRSERPTRDDRSAREDRSGRSREFQRDDRGGRSAGRPTDGRTGRPTSRSEGPARFNRDDRSQSRDDRGPARGDRSTRSASRGDERSDRPARSDSRPSASRGLQRESRPFGSDRGDGGREGRRDDRRDSFRDERSGGRSEFQRDDRSGRSSGRPTDRPAGRPTSRGEAPARFNRDDRSQGRDDRGPVRGDRPARPSARSDERRPMRSESSGRPRFQSSGDDDRPSGKHPAIADRSSSSERPRSPSRPGQSNSGRPTGKPSGYPAGKPAGKGSSNPRGTGPRGDRHIPGTPSPRRSISMKGKPRAPKKK